MLFFFQVMGYLDQEDRGRIKIQDNVLTINGLEDERDPGMYQCRASNTLKTTYSSGQLRVLGIYTYCSIQFRCKYMCF